MRWKILFITVFALLIAVFAIRNSTRVEVNFLILSTQLNLIFVILLSVLLGMVLSTALWSAQTIKWRRRTKELNGQIAQLQEKLRATGDGGLMGETVTPESNRAESATPNDSVTSSREGDPK